MYGPDSPSLTAAELIFVLASHPAARLATGCLKLSHPPDAAFGWGLLLKSMACMGSYNHSKISIEKAATIERYEMQLNGYIVSENLISVVNNLVGNQL